MSNVDLICGKCAVGPLRGGMQRSVVRDLMGAWDEFMKSPFSKVATDEFMGGLMHVYYEPGLVVKGVELFPGSGAKIFGVDVFSVSISEFISELSRVGETFSLIDEGVRLNENGLRIYCPDMHDSTRANIKSIYVEMV